MTHAPKPWPYVRPRSVGARPQTPPKRPELARNAKGIIITSRDAWIADNDKRRAISKAKI